MNTTARIEFGRNCENLIISPITELVAVANGRYITLVQHTLENHYVKKWKKCNFILKGDNVFCWMDEETNFKDYNNFNLN